MVKFSLAFFLLLSFIGCESYNNVDHEPSVVGDIVDSTAWYADELDEVIDINVSVPVPNEYLCAPYDNTSAPLRPCTLLDVYNDTDPYDLYEPKLHVQLSARDYQQINEQMNASFAQKGKSTRTSLLKSYRIKLDKDMPLIFHERTLQLNKHPNDYSRVRNKMAFEFFEDIPNFTSLKTRFCRLYVNGEDYGLFTHVENGDEYFLINRGWNKDDYLYKAQNFAFRVEVGMELDSKGNPVNKEAFEAIIEPQTGEDYTKLIEMLNAINQDMSDAEFEVVFNKYFNRNNYITWMAVNIVMANKDTVSQNFFLYNPKYSDTFYITPWDYDGTARDTDKYAKWELGIGTWWGIPLHNKFLKIAKNREDLDAMVTKLRNEYITPEKVQAKLDRYKPLIEPLILERPDSEILSETNWRTEFDSLVSRLDVNIQNYRDQIGSPMPFWQAHSYEDGVLKLMWDQSIDFENDEIVYDVQLGFAADFNTTAPIVDEKGLSIANGDLNVTSWGEVSYSFPIALNPGDRLFMKITAKEKDNPAHFQIAFDKEVVVDDIHYFGELEFVIE